MRHRVRRWIEVPRGATAVEYLIILVVAVVFLLAVVELFAGGIEAQFTAVADIIREDMGQEPKGGVKDGEERAGSGHGDEYASAAGAGAGGGDGAGEGGASKGGPASSGGEVADRGASAGSVGGINPIVILLALVLLLLLGFVVFGNKKE